ncbi:MAG: carbohydrate binding domain-containing protein [Patescibacteria group bacterium]
MINFPRKIIYPVVAVIVLMLSGVTVWAMTEDWVSWPMQWDESADSVASAAFLNDYDIDARGFVEVNPETGDFELGDGTTLRFWGSQVWTDATTPTTTIADGVAPHLRKHGFNIMRIGINTEHIDTQDEWERFTYFLKQLKDEGIYVALQVMAGISFDTLLDETARQTRLEWIKDDLLMRDNPYDQPFYNNPQIAMLEITNELSFQRFYHYHRLNYNTEGCHPTQGQNAYRYPVSQSTSNYLDQEFSQWLLNKYGDRDTLEAAWLDSPATDPAGANSIVNGGFESSMDNWTLTTGDGCEASSQIISDAVEGSQAIQIDVTQAGETYWKTISLSYNGPMALTEGNWYTVGFWAKSDAPNPGEYCGTYPYQFTVMVRGLPGIVYGDNNMPYIDAIDDGNSSVDDDWKYYQVSFLADETVTSHGFRLTGFGYKTGTIWFDDITIKENGVYGLRSWEDPDPASENVWRLQLLDQFSFSAPRYRDTVEFYVDKEREFTGAVTDYLTNNIFTGDRPLPPISGSQPGGTLGGYADTTLGRIDIHSYYNSVVSVEEDSYVREIGRPWSIISTARQDPPWDNLIAPQAKHQVAGMPLTVSEHNVGYPHPYRYESPLLTAAYSAYQGWDGIYWFNYHSDGDETWEDVNALFGGAHGVHNIESNSQTMVQMIQTAIMYRRGDIQQADRFIDVSLTKNETLDGHKIGDEGRSRDKWGLGGYPYDLSDDLDWRYLMLYGVRISSYEAVGPRLFEDLKTEYGLPDIRTWNADELKFVSDTGELTWDVSDNGGEFEDHFLINTPKTQSVAGRLMYGVIPRTLSTDNMEVTASDPEYGAVTLTSMDNNDIAQSESLLISGLRQAANQGSTWDADEEILTMIQNDTMLEPVNAQITLVMAANSESLTVTPLDKTGQVIDSSLPVNRTAYGDRVEYQFDISGPIYDTVWYSIAQTFTEECVENWQCTEWSECVTGQQTRTCTDINECGTEIDKPSEVQECDSVSPETIDDLVAN